MAENKNPPRNDTVYEYDEANPIGPARRFVNNVLTAELAWSDPLRLAVYRDHGTLLEYSFAYTDAGIVDKARIAAFRPETGRSDAAAGSDWLGALVARKKRQRLHDFLGGRSTPLELLCGCDQVGTLKLLTDKNGRLVKEIMRDSFGVPQADSFPDLFLPIGFAGGLVDPDTGLVRFGWRDYDPAVGRFTAPDPLGDTGGDHDLYEYCLDDPVSRIDPAGLLPAVIMAKAVAEGILHRIGISSAKKAGVKLGLSSIGFNDIANEPEEMMDVRQRILAIEKKITAGQGTKDDMTLLEKQRKRENELWEKFGDHYGDEPYLHLFPDSGYVERKRKQAGKR